MESRVSDRKRSGYRNILFCAVVLGLILLMSIQVSAAAVTYTIKFNNRYGTSTSNAYKRLEIVARKNQVITLPTVADLEGYRTVGWTTEKGGTTPIYKMGSKVKATKSMTYYLVRQKIDYCTVRFYTNRGATAFTALNKKVEKGKTIKLPQQPTYSLYTSKGWTQTKGSSTVTYKAGASVKVTANLKFFAIYQKKPVATVTLYSYDGKTKYTTKTVAKGDTYKLPGLLNPSGYTMMGWAKTAKQSFAASSAYYVGESITVKKDIVLYAAMFNHSLEPNLNPASLPVAAKYQKVIFVGDSRTYRLGLTMKAQGVNISNVSFVGMNSSGLGWLQSTGYQRLKQEIGDGVAPGEKPIAIIFNHGINDLHRQSEYITYMKLLAREFRPMGCKLFYMSVNPDNSKILKKRNAIDIREEERVRAFNTAIEKSLCANGTYTYLNTYNYFMKKGFSMDNNPNGYDVGIDDGAHYSVKTCKIIYWYCITKLNNLTV